MNIHIKASLKDRCEPVIANIVCINASRKMISGGGGRKTLFLNLFKKKKKVDVNSSSSQV